MIIKVTKSMFRDAFRTMGRADQFSYEALGALFDYLDDMDCDASLELDVIALCCEFSEYENMEQFNAQNGTEYGSMAELEQETTVIDIDGERFIVGEF